MSKFEVTVVSDEKIATVTVEAASHSEAKRKAVQLAEKAYRDRVFVHAGVRKVS